LAKYFLFLLIITCPLGDMLLKAQSLEQDLQGIFEDFELMGLSVGIAVNGATESFHFGFRDFDRLLEVNENTKFRIASVSKSFTALGVMKLFDQGLIDLDDDISNYLPYTVENPAFPGTSITFRMLLSHTSSLQDGGGYNNFLNATYTHNPIPNISELIVPGGVYYTSNMWRMEPPGTYFSYSNINYGLLGTLIEAVSGERFDEYMKAEILEPMGISGSFNIQDVPEVNDIGVLYRNIGGWQPQFDNYQGVMPPPPDLSGYTPGTNGVYFAPQGGLRIGAGEMVLFSEYIRTGGSSAPLGISAATLSEMKNIAWDYNGNNGDNYGGLFNRWGLGLHHSNVNQGDQICGNFEYGTFLGHPGEAYGLISDGYFSEASSLAFSILINGIWNGYVIGSNTSYYQVEEAIFSTLCDYFSQTLELEENKRDKFSIYPNPTDSGLHISTSTLSGFSVRVYNLLGEQVFIADYEDHYTFIDLSYLESGMYMMEITTTAVSEVFKLLKK